MSDAGDPLLLPTERGPRLRRLGVEFYSPDDPQGSANRRADSVALEPDSLVFVPSVGLGHGLARLLGRLPRGCAVLCVEVDESVMRLAAAAGLPADPRLAVVRTSDEAAALAALLKLGPGRFRRVIEAPLCAGYRLDPARYQAIRASLERGLASRWRNRLTLIALGQRLVRNLYANLPMLVGARDASDLAVEQPVVVAGAGPSLRFALGALARHRRRLVLAACDTALPPLAAAGIVPDLVVCLEAQHANLADFLPCRDRGMALACELTAFPGVPRLFADRRWFFSSTFAPVAILDRLDRAGLRPLAIPPLGSVGVATAHLALRMARSTVVLCGLDFSYPGRVTHTRGVAGHLAALASCGRLAPIEHVSFASLAARGLVLRDGRVGPVATDSVLLSYRDSLAELLAADRATRREERVFEAAGEGLASGAKPLTERGLSELLGAFAARHPRALERGGPDLWSAEAVRAFLETEQRLLAEGERVAAELLARSAGANPDPGDRAALEALDHAWMAFPDEPDLGEPDATFLARLVPWLRLYAERARRSRQSLGGAKPPA